MVYSKKFIHSKEDLLEEGKRIITESRDSKFLFRVTLVNLMLAGAKASDLAEYCGVDERTLTGWVAKVDEKGFQSLMAVKQSGRPPKLSEDQKEIIKVALSEGPQDHGYSNWDGPSVSDLILRTFGVEYSVRQSQRLIKDLGFSLVRRQIYSPYGERRRGVPNPVQADHGRNQRRPVPGRRFPERGSFQPAINGHTPMG